ncbi:uncharacterized protein [Henckelia pumila]|uniref:uncharacterized protein n=1 Tax=Henckelia pumila TaxID=405737 RepID=UPI003C6E8929
MLHTRIEPATLENFFSRHLRPYQLAYAPVGDYLVFMVTLRDAVDLNPGLYFVLFRIDPPFHEKRGRLPHPPSLISGFRETVTACGLIDLGMKGHMFTWEKSQGTFNFVEERLDRAMATSSWLNLFNNAVVHNIEVVSSDHCALFLKSKSFTIDRTRKFRFKNFWLLEPDCREVIQNSWDKGMGMDIQHHIATSGKDLFSWGEEVILKFKSRINHCRDQIKHLKQRWFLGVDQCIIDFRYKLNSLLAQEELFWKQRSKLFWLQADDANTKLFHSYASSRRRKNIISQLTDHQGISHSWGSGLSELIFSYFDDFFSSRGCVDQQFFQLLSHRITEEQSQLLVQPFVESEILDALRSMHPDKSPGLDGMNPGFFQKFWDITGGYVSTSCLNYLNNCFFPDHLNDTALILILKKHKPDKINDLRPISLCNVVYKIISKVLANRFKMVLNSIISEPQSAFTSGRYITDNVIIAFEIGHYLKRKTQGMRGAATLKLDMSKAFDRVEWQFLRLLLNLLGFPCKFVDLVMLCVSYVRYMVIHNNHEIGLIIPHRGLRQGDPLSPYLFLICTEGLSSLLQTEVHKGNLHGVKADLDECRIIKDCLRKYETTSDLERMMNSFWWGKHGNSNGGIRWKIWTTLSKRKTEGGLGFKKLHEHNLALLSKLGWKLLTDPTSLASWVLKARYYPVGDFLNVKIGANPSYIWRSIMQSQHIVRQGVRWRIGTGYNVKIWGDPWLPDSDNPFVITDCLSDISHVKVSALINPSNGCWDADLIKALFVERDQHLILSISLSHHPTKDKWIWMYEKNGVFSVKSGYKAQLHSRDSSPFVEITNWNLLWKLRIPAKCGVSHPWGVSIAAVSIIDWWNSIAINQEPKDIEITALVMWSIWQNRNNVIWNGQCSPAICIYFSALDLHSQWHNAHIFPSVNTPITERFWHKPPRNILKCNVDAAILPNPPHVGVDSILRDHHGIVIASSQGRIHGLQDPATAEALAIREALSWLKNFNFFSIIVESDSLVVIDALNHSVADRSPFGLLIEDCKLLAQGVASCTFVFTRRSANQAAHALAKATGSMPDLVGRIDLHPTVLLNVIAPDLSS